MKQITDYELVAAKSRTELKTVVREKIAKGWQPFEAPFLINHNRADDKEIAFIQTMVKYKKN
jgi:hypothetical protein